MLMQGFPHLQQRCWGQYLWGSGYFCPTIGAVAHEMIKECVENQHHERGREQNFRVVDYPSFSRVQLVTRSI